MEKGEKLLQRDEEVVGALVDKVGVAHVRGGVAEAGPHGVVDVEDGGVAVPRVGVQRDLGLVGAHLLLDLDRAVLLEEPVEGGRARAALRGMMNLAKPV